MPIGLFGTNFQETTDGLQFQVIPISGALGTKGYTGNWYFGFSAMAGWTWNVNAEAETDESQSEEGDPPAEEGAAPPSADFSVSATSFGVLVDVNNYFFVGAAYIKDWKEDVKDPGFVGVLGLPVDLLK